MESRFMETALELARKAAEEGEVPVGAVIVRKKDGAVVGTGRNRREDSRCPLAHAELEAIAQASRAVGGWRLNGCEMYVTLEPCPMCAGAIINSRLDGVVFGAYDKKAGSCGSVFDLFSLPYNHIPKKTGGVLEEKCSDELKKFFRKRRSVRMNGIKLVSAQTEDQFVRIAEIAGEIWREFFPGIISEEQIEYMLEKFCSAKAMMENALKEGYIYYFIKKDGRDIGYTAIKPEDDGRLFLSKIYIYKQERGKKYARSVMELHKQYCRENNLRAIWLTVNKHNDSSVAAYKAMGFEVSGEGVTNIGNGFVMDDYFMELMI